MQSHYNASNEVEFENISPNTPAKNDAERQDETCLDTINKKMSSLEKFTGAHLAIDHWRSFFRKSSPHIYTSKFETTKLAKLEEVSKRKNAHGLFLEIDALIKQHNRHISQNHSRYQATLFKHYREVERSTSTAEKSIEDRIVLSF
jgi:hypothetical protein